jgi:hypothetical protein
MKAMPRCSMTTDGALGTPRSVLERAGRCVDVVLLGAMLCLTLRAAPAGSTEVDVAFNTAPNADLRDPDLPAATQVSALTGELKLGLNPIALADKRWLLTNHLRYHLALADADLLEAVFGSPVRSLHGASWQLGTMVTFFEQWSAVGFLRGGLYGDLAEGVSLQHFRTRGACYAQRTLEGPWALGLGVAYAAMPEGPILLPLLRAEYGGERLQMSLSLPQSVELRVPLVNERLQVGGQAAVSSGDYHIGSAEPVDTDLAYYLGAIGPLIEARGDTIRLGASAEWMFWRKYTLYQGEETTEVSPEPGWSFGLTAGYTPRSGS